MLYSLKRIGIYIRKNILVYLLIIAQLTAGLGLFIGGINVLNKAEDDLLQAKKKESEQIINVNITDGPSFDEMIEGDIDCRFRMQYSDYLNLEKEFGDTLKFGFSLVSSEWIGEDRENGLEVRPRNYYFMNNTQFEMLFGTQIDENAIYAGSNVQPILQEFIDKKISNEIFIEKSPDTNIVQVIYIQDGKIKLMNKHTLNLQPMPKEVLVHTAVNEVDEDISSNDCIIIPMKYYPEAEQEYKRMISIDKPKVDYTDSGVKEDGTIRSATYRLVMPPLPELKLTFIDENFDEYVVAKVITYLNDNSKYGNVFSVENAAGERQSQIGIIKMLVTSYQIKAAALLAIALLGNMGVMMLFLQSRKKSLAIAKAYGASNLRLTLEIFSELMLINGVGAVLSLFAVNVAIPIIQNIMPVSAVTQPQNILYAAAFAIVCSILPTIYAMVSVNKIQPIEVLKND